MEVIELDGYTLPEKKVIFRNHIFPKVLKETGMDWLKVEIDINDSDLEKLIDSYAWESGVRGLEKQTQFLLEKLVYEFVTSQNFTEILKSENPQENVEI